VSVNFCEAAEYFKLADGQNYPQAEYYHCLVNGCGVARDMDLALALISLADESDVTKWDKIQRIENTTQVKLLTIP
jgi:pentatricopeptide repeat protein